MKQVLIPAPASAAVFLAAPAAADVAGLGPYVGQWGAHGESLTVNSDGSGSETFNGGSVNFRISDVRDNTAYGSITGASSSRSPVGGNVALQLADGGRGLLLTIAGGDTGFPFCKKVNGSYVNSADCGA
jgi:hypothetical protein